MNDNFPKDSRSTIESENFKESILFEDQATPTDKEVSIPRLTLLRMSVRSDTPHQILHTSLDHSFKHQAADSDNDDY